MKTIQQILAIILLTTASGILHGQNLKFKSPGVFRDTTIIQDTIQLKCDEIQSQDLSKILENDSLQVSVPLNAFKRELESHIEKYQIESDIELLNAIKMQSAKDTNFELIEIMEDHSSRAGFVLATLLEQGNSCIVDLKVDKEIRTLTKEIFLKNNSSGRQFYSENKMLVFGTYDGSF